VVRPGVVPEDPYVVDLDGRPVPMHRLVAGERRHRAIKRLIERGDWTPDRPIPCKVVDIDDAGHRRIALVENLQRKDLRPIDELALLEIGWAIAAKPNTQWTTTPCDYTAPKALEDAGLVHFYRDYFTGSLTARLESKAFGHLRAISGADDSLTRALLEPLLRK